MRRQICRAVALGGLAVALTGCASNTSAGPSTTTTPAAGPATPMAGVPGAASPLPGVARTPLGVTTPVVPTTGFSTQYVYKRSAARVPACAHAGRVIALPRAFPATFPFPPGTAITAQQGYRGDLTRPVISGIVPSATFASTVSFFLQELPRAGYRIRDGEAETFEAESVFLGRGYIGRWRIRALDSCPSAMVLFAFAERYPLAGK